MVGAYYFDGWGGRHKLADDPNQPWAKDAPTHLTRRMVEEFPEREPVWGVACRFAGDHGTAD